MNVTSVFNKNLEAYNQRYRYIVNKGSTRSSKTYSQLQLLYLIAELSKEPKTISILSESMPHLKKGCIRDFQEILQKEGKWNAKNWNATDKIYRINNSIIEFFSADNPSKVHGPSRNILYVNECINIEYETYRQLAIRTTETIFLDCNPCFEFWLDTKVLNDEKTQLPNAEAILIHSIYKDNEYLNEAQIKEIESNRHDVNWWRVYGEGLIGHLVGTVILNWEIVEDMPVNYKNRWIGIDFGFTNDPTAIVDIRLSEGELWIDELCYEKGLVNVRTEDEHGNVMPNIDDILRACSLPKDISIVADSAEPKSIQEIRSQGWRVEPAQKGKDSINTGISILNRYKKNVTSRSVNIVREYRNYKYRIDDYGETTNIPTDRYNHSIDAQRYVCLNKLLERNSALSYSIIKGKC